MTYIAFKIPVIEYERGWGNKFDDWMVCLSENDIFQFKIEFNSKNVDEKPPDWYMIAEGSPEPVFLTEVQYNELLIHKRMWLKYLNGVKEDNTIDSKQSTTKTGSLNEAVQQVIENQLKKEQTLEQAAWELAKEKFEEKCNYKPNLQNSQDLLVVSSIQEGILIGIKWEQDRKKNEKE